MTWYQNGKPVSVIVDQPQAAPAQAAQTAIGPSGFPEDAAYGKQVELAQRQYGDVMAGITQQRGQTEQNFGFGTDISNPYSQAKMLERSYKQNQMSSTNSYAGTGQLYAGSLQNAQNTNRFNYDQGVDTAKRKYQDILAQLSQREREAGTAQEEAKLGAGFGALDRAAQSEPIDYGSASLPPGVTAPRASGGSRVNLSAAQRKALSRRTTKSSKARYLKKYG